MKNKFNVEFPHKNSKVNALSLVLIIITSLVIIMQVIVNKENPITMCIIFGPIMLFAIIFEIMIKLFYIKARGKTLNVRTCFGRKYSFELSDITKVEWNKRVDNRMNYERIIIETKNGEHVSVDNMMVGFNKMTSYIEENVEVEKIYKRFS